MEWFKHDTGASTDAKMRKLIMRHGAIGYAVYFHCLELIMSDVNKDNITFQLEHDSEIIADNLKITGNSTESGVDIVEKIMYTLIDLELFESSCNKITCFKLLTRLDSSMTSNTIFRKKIAETKQNSNESKNIMIPSCSSHDTIMQEENRIEENRIEEKKNRIEKINKPKKEPKQSYYDLDLVKLTQKEYESCISNYGEEQTIKAINKLNSFIGSSGKKYKSHFHTLGTWVWESVKAVKLSDREKQDNVICEVF